MMRFRFITVVWGKEYTELFLKVAIPNQLTAGNLQFFGESEAARYVIYTTAEEKAVIERDRIYPVLAKTIQTDIRIIDEHERIEGEHKYARMTRAHRQAVLAEAGESDECAFVFLAPDLIWSDGTFRELAKLAASGKRAVLVSGIKVTKETFVPAFQKAFYADPCHAPVAPRELVRIALNHLHPFSKSLFWNARNFNEFPATFYFQAGKHGLLGRFFVLHPLMVIPVNKGELPGPMATDGDYLNRTCPSYDDLHLVDDSDFLVGFEISTIALRDGMPEPGIESPRGWRRIYHVARWAVPADYGHHRRYVRRNIRIHSEDWDANGREAERVAGRTVVRIMAVFFPLAFAHWARGLLHGAVSWMRRSVRIRTRLKQVRRALAR